MIGCMQGTAIEWKTVFYISSGIACFGGLTFIIFAKGEMLDWAKDEAANREVTFDNISSFSNPTNSEIDDQNDALPIGDGKQTA
jgi:hypothetical protein